MRTEHVLQERASLRLLHPQRYFPDLAHRLALLEQEFGTCVGCNAYLTPPDSQVASPCFWRPVLDLHSSSFGLPPRIRFQMSFLVFCSVCSRCHIFCTFAAVTAWERPFLMMCWPHLQLRFLDMSIEWSAAWYAAQGFAPHWDDIDAFILQLEGSKR